jgi:hypothetical protein
MGHLHFLLFGDGSPQMRGAARRLERQAARTGLFQTVRRYSLKEIRDRHRPFWRQHGAFLLRHGRGCGYFLWKPFLVAATLSELPANDFLVYADAGCEIVPARAPALLDFLPTEPTKDVGAIPLEAFHTTARWTSGFCLSHIDNANRYLDRPQFAASMLFVKNTDASKNLMARWFDHAVCADYGCLIDRPGEHEKPQFQEHRHDQAIFSLLVYDFEQRGALGVERIDATRVSHADAPIVAVRNRTPFPLVGRNKHIRMLLCKAQNGAVRLFWDERRYRSKLGRPLNDDPA